MDNTPLYLEYQRLDNLGDELEKKEYCEDIQELLEQIGQRQCEILNQIFFN